MIFEGKREFTVKPANCNGLKQARPHERHATAAEDVKQVENIYSTLKKDMSTNLKQLPNDAMSKLKGVDYVLE